VTENRVGPPSRPTAVTQQRRYQRLRLLTSSLTMVTNSTVIGGKDEGSEEPFRYVIDRRRLGMQAAGLPRLAAGTDEFIFRVHPILATKIPSVNIGFPIIGTKTER